MGKAIEQVALSKGHTIALKLNSQNICTLTKENLKNIDIAIEFSTPHTAFENVKKCLLANVSVVCGTTGWNHQLEEIKELCIQQNTAFLHASNFSVGVNIFFEMNRLFSKMMNAHTEYKIAIEETHHIHKKDKPSGTAITIAENIISASTHKSNWQLGVSQQDETISIDSVRVDEVPGTHKVTYSSSCDEIALTHTAFNRDGFAQGAVLAAEFLNGKKGIFTMKDILGL